MTTSSTIMTIRPSWYIVISTMARYKEACECLLASLRKVNWPESQIIMVYGSDPNMPINHDRTDIQHYCLDVNLYEYNAFLGINAMDIETNATYMLIHDTCEVGPQFVEKVSKAFTRFDEESRDSPGDPRILWLSEVGHANICMFNKAGANSVSLHFKGMTSMDKVTAIRIELDMHELSLKRLPIAMSRLNDHPMSQYPVPKYSSGSPRNVKYFINLDLYKYYFHVSSPDSHPEMP